MYLKNKVAIVTGATRGIGRSIAETFAEEGADVVLNGRNIDTESFKEMVEGIERNGSRVLTVQGDAGLSETADRIVRSTLNAFGRIDILVNNVGISPMASIEQITEQDWDEVMRVNLKSVFLCSKAVFPHMKAQKSGVILNISSGSAKSGGVGAHYASSKGAINTLTKSLAFEGARDGIRANAIAPGPVATEMADSLFDSERMRFLNSVIPLKRFASPKDIADTAVFLCSDEASYVTGEVVELDGGLLFYKPLSYLKT